jgi:hypothetical protein
VAILEKDAAVIMAAEAKTEVGKLIAVARRHVGQLEKIAATHARAGAH